MLEIIKRGEYSLVAGKVTKTRDGQFNGNKVITITLTDGNESLDIEFWNNQNFKRADMVRNVCVDTFLSVYIKKTPKRNLGYIVKRQGVWKFPASLKAKPISFDDTIKDLIKDGIIESRSYEYAPDDIKNLIFQVKDVSEEFCNTLKDLIVEEQNVLISTITQVDKYDSGLVKVSLPVTSKDVTEYYKVAFRGKQSENAFRLLSPDGGIKKKAIIICGKKNLYNNIPNLWGFAFKVI